MKKKLLAMLLAVSCVLSLTACSSQEDTLDAEVVDINTEEAMTETVEETIEETTAVPETVAETAAEKADRGEVNTPSELSDDVYSFQVSIDGTIYQFPMWASDLAALGWTYDGDATQTLSSNEYTVAETWVKDDISIYTTLSNLSMNTVTMTESMVAGIEVDDYLLKDAECEIILPKGIQYGVSTKDDVIAAYGTPNYEYDGENWYKMGYEKDYHQNVYLYISTETGVLCKLEVENMVELEGADNSVDATVPDVVKNYKAPSALGEDLYEFDIELEGKLYTLPCPVSELLANGFTINEDNSESAFGAQGSGWLEIVYNNQAYHTIVHNYADYATTAENCFITDIETSIYDPKYNLTIPCGIKRGDSEESVLEKIKDYNYEKTAEEGSEFTYYEITNPEGSSLEGYDIVIKGGEVVIIEVSTDREPQ